MSSEKESAEKPAVHEEAEAGGPLMLRDVPLILKEGVFLMTKNTAAAVFLGVSIPFTLSVAQAQADKIIEETPAVVESQEEEKWFEPYLERTKEIAVTAKEKAGKLAPWNSDPRVEKLTALLDEANKRIAVLEMQKVSMQIDQGVEFNKALSCLKGTLDYLEQYEKAFNLEN